MPTYSYEGIDREGHKVSGIRQCHSEKGLVSTLLQEGIYVESISETKDKHGGLRRWFVNRGISRQLPDIFFQLALLLKSGIPLSTALQTLADSSSNQRLKTVLLDILSDISQGTKFSMALQKIPSLCHGIYVHMIIAAEASGRLDDVLMSIAGYEEQKSDAYNKIKAALVYPLTVLMLGMGVLGFLLTYVVPKIQKIFWTAQKDIPLSTKILIKAGFLFKHYGLIFLIMLLGVTVLIKILYAQNNKFRLWIDTRLYKIDFIRQLVLARFSDIVAFQLKQAIPVAQALELGSMVSWNRALQKKVQEIVELIKAGNSLSKSVRQVEFFPEIFIAAVATGEKSGNLPEILERIGNFYMKNTEGATNKFMSMIEPVFIVFIGALVGFIVISIMGPLFQINTFISIK